MSSLDTAPLSLAPAAPSFGADLTGPSVRAVVLGLTFQPRVIWAEFHSVAGEYPILKNHLLGVIVLFTTSGDFKVKNQQNTDVWIVSSSQLPYWIV